MFQTVNISNGKLIMGMLEWQIFDENGKTVDLDFRGEVIIQDNHFRIFQTANVVYDFIIAGHPTLSSVDYKNGYEKALSQQRRREPRNVSDDYYLGWQAGWKNKND